MSNDHDLVELGFVVGDDGTLVATSASITLTPIDGGPIAGDFFRLKVSLPDGNSIVAVVSALAIRGQGWREWFRQPGPQRTRA